MSRKITSPEDLRKLRESTRAELEVRGETKASSITVHMGTCGIAAGARDVMSELMRSLAEHKVAEVTLRQSGCIGLCDQEPMLTLKTGGREYLYVHLDRARAARIVAEHVVGGRPVTALLSPDAEGGKA